MIKWKTILMIAILCLSITACRPKDAALYYERGMEFLNDDDIENAISEFNRAIKIDPEYSSAYYQRGVAYSKKGYRTSSGTLHRQSLKNAIDDFSIVIEKNPQNDDAFVQRGDAYFALAHIIPAIADYDRAIEINPQRAYAYYSRGNCFILIGENQKALPDMERALELGLEPPHKESAEFLLDALRKGKVKMGN